MNILYLTEFMSAIGGGGEVAFANIIKEMGRRGHRVQVICRNSINDQSGREKEWENVTISRLGRKVDLRHGWFPSRTEQVSFVLQVLRDARKLVKANDIEIIHANTLSPAVAGGILGLFHDIPVVTTFHHVEAIQSRRQGQACHPGKRQLEVTVGRSLRLLYERGILALPFKSVHAVSRTTAAELVRLGYRGRIEVIPNGLEIPDYHATEDAHYLLFVGRLVRQKNLGVVIDAFAKTLKSLPEARLVIVGDGPMRNEWTRQAQELNIGSNVVFTGYVSDQAKLDLIRKCSALVFPSTIEGFGMSVAEAFAMSKPALVSDIEALSELVTDGVEGFVISPSSIAEWDDRMRRILANRSLAHQMGEAGRRKATELLQIEKVGERIETLYEKVLSKPSVLIKDVRLDSRRVLG